MKSFFQDAVMVAVMFLAGLLAAIGIFLIIYTILINIL